MLQRMTTGTAFNFLIQEKVYTMIIIDSWSHGGEPINISIMNKLKLVILKLWLLHMAHQDHLDQG